MAENQRLITRIEKALWKVAVLCELNDAYLPVFERLSSELEIAKAKTLDNPIARVRARLRAVTEPS